MKVHSKLHRFIKDSETSVIYLPGRARLETVGSRGLFFDG